MVNNGNVPGGGGSAGTVSNQIANQAASTFTGTAQGGVSNVLPVGSAVVTGIVMIRAG